MIDHNERAAEARALRQAAADARSMHDPVPSDCEEWASWLEARAARVEQAASSGSIPPDSPEANARAQAEGQTIALPSVQPPTREQVAEAIRRSYDALVHHEHERAPLDADYRAADAVLALFPQPTPSAEPDTRAMQMTMADLLNQWDDVRHLNRCAINDWWYRRTSRHSLELQRLAAEPVTVDRDSLMADLLRRRDKNGHLTIRDIERAFGAAPSIDETATRDVNPPPATPEESER